MEDSERTAIRDAVLTFARERLGSDVHITIDLVNLDRGGEGGLVYYDGAIVRRHSDGEVLDGLHRLHAVSESVERRVAEVGDDPVEGAIYVTAGPTPDYVVDRKTETILIGRNRGDREASLDEMRKAVERAMSEYFGN